MTTTFNNIREATLEAQYRTGDYSLRTAVKAGLIKIIRVTNGAISTIQEVTDFMPAEEAVRTLNAMGRA